MILSYNVPQNKDDSSDMSIKEESFKDTNKMIKEKPLKQVEEGMNQSGFSQNNISGWEEGNVSLSNSSQISKIEYKNSSVSSSLREGLSRAEECIQKEVLLIMDEDSIRKTKEIIKPEYIDKDKKSSTEEDKIIDISNVSLNSQKSKNFILKSSLLMSKENNNANKANDSKEKQMQKIKNSFNGCINKQKTANVSNEKADEKEFSKTPKLIHNHHQENTFTSCLFNNQQFTNDNTLTPHHNTHKVIKNDSDDIIQRIDFLSINSKRQNLINNNSYPHDYQSSNYQALGQSQAPVQPSQSQGNSQGQKQGRLMLFTSQEEQKSQLIKQLKSRFDISNETDLIANCLKYAKEQTGCRLLQKFIDENPNVVDEILYPNIIHQLIDLSCDSFGNYFIQKILSYITLDKVENILTVEIPNSFRQMSLNPHGTRVIQKIFERILKDDKLLTFYSQLLRPNLKDFILDANASHIIIQYVSLLSPPYTDFIVDFLCQNVIEIATQKHSCCALQKCIESVNNQQKKILFTSIAMNSFNFFADQYGNYVVQFVINACDYEINHMIMINVLRDFKQFSIQKYSSNVIEKCLSYCSEQTKEIIVKHLCDNSQLIQQLLLDMYGNYVLQKCMNISKEPYRTKLFTYIGSLMNKLQFVSFGSKLYNKLISTFPELIQYIKSESGMSSHSKKKNYNNNSNSNNSSNSNNTPNNNSNSNNLKPQLNMNMNMSPLLSSPPINSFQNFGNVYYQANPLYNPYLQMHNPQASNYLQMQMGYIQPTAMNQPQPQLQPQPQSGMFYHPIPTPIMTPNMNHRGMGYIPNSMSNGNNIFKPHYY